MSIVNDTRMRKLQRTFPKLTEINQIFMLGFVEGLKRAQGEGEDSGKIAGNGEMERRVWRVEAIG